LAAADSGSVYEPHPILTFEWDPDLERKIQPKMHKEHPSFDLGPHPADPNHTLNGLPLDPINGNGNATHGPNFRREQVPAHEIWVYAGHAGQVTVPPRKKIIDHSDHSQQDIHFLALCP
jgi:hypothetical protein